MVIQLVYVIRYIAVFFIAIGFSVSGVITKRIQKGLINIGKKAERKLRTQVQSKIKKIIYCLAKKLGRAAVSKLFEKSVSKIVTIIFMVLAWRGFTIELAIAEAFDRLDGKNDNYICA